MSTSPEDYQASEQENESPDTGTEYNRATGEPEVTPHDRELAEEEADARNPNAGTSAGLEGDMGISSERRGPADETGTSGLGELGELDTRTVGTARGRTHGATPTATPGQPTSGATRQVHGPEMDDTQQAATQEWRDQQPEAEEAREQNPDPVAGHRLSNKNPGHSGGTPGQGS